LPLADVLRINSGATLLSYIWRWWWWSWRSFAI